jgi:protein tyrosine/serine phosphatase
VTSINIPDEASSAPLQPRRRKRRAVVRSTFLAAALGLAVPGSFLMRPWLDGNVGVVDPGLVIRSAQPTSQLERMIKEHHLESILNLRGGSSRDPWYTAEVRTADASGVSLFDLPLNATRRPGRRELLLIIDVLDRCTYPLLIHCKAGADRTGLASALYLMQRRGESPRQAMRAFTLFHSHIPFFGTQHLHEPLEEYATWLDSKQLAHTAQRFRDWVKDDYQSSDDHTDPPPLAPGPRKPL